MGDVMDRNSLSIVLLHFLWFAQLDKIRAPTGGGTDAIALHHEARGRVIRFDRLQNLDEPRWDGPQHGPGTIAGRQRGRWSVVGNLEDQASKLQTFNRPRGPSQFVLDHRVCCQLLLCPASAIPFVPPLSHLLVLRSKYRTNLTCSYVLARTQERNSGQGPYRRPARQKARPGCAPSPKQNTDQAGP